MGDKTRGLYEKFRVERTDGHSSVGGKHEGCDYFVLDLTHDPHAWSALRGYVLSLSASGEYELLRKDLHEKIEAHESFRPSGGGGR